MEKREIFRCALIGGCWHGEVVGGLTRSRMTCDAHLFLWLVPRCKWGQNLGKLSVINQILAILDQLLQGLLFVFLNCY